MYEWLQAQQYYGTLPLIREPNKDYLDAPFQPQPGYASNPGASYGKLLSDLQREVRQGEAQLRFMLNKMLAEQELIGRRQAWHMTQLHLKVLSTLSTQYAEPHKNIGTDHLGYLAALYAYGLYQQKTEQLAHGRDQGDWPKNLAKAGVVGLAMLNMTPPAVSTMSTLYSGLAAAGKFADAFGGNLAVLAKRLTIGYALYQAYLMLTQNRSDYFEHYFWLDQEYYEETDDAFAYPVVPVTVNEAESTTKVLQTAKSQTLTIEYGVAAYPTEPRQATQDRPWLKLNPLRAYPRIALDIPAVIPIAFPRPIADIKVEPYIRPIALSLTLTSPTAIVITRAETAGRTVHREQYTPRHDKKSKAMLQYLAQVRIAHAALHTVTEVLDFKEAILNATKVRIGGQWWTLENLSLRSKKAALAGMFSGEFKYVVDWQMAARNLLANEYIDRKVAVMKQAEAASLKGLGIFNTYGSPSTWLSRSQ